MTRPILPNRYDDPIAYAPSLAAVTLPPKGGAMPQAARAGRASHRALLHGLGHSAPIAIAAFALFYFGGELLRAVLS